MATIYKRGPCYYLNWFDGGQQLRRSLGKITKQEAEALCAEKEAEIRGIITTTRGITVRNIVVDYLRWYQSARPTTYKRALSAFKSFQSAFDTYPAESLSPNVIERWEANHAAPGTAHKAIKLAKAAFRRGVRLGTIRINPMDRVQSHAPPLSRAPDYYRPDELAKLYKEPHGAIWRFMASTGIRRGEMAKAKGSDVRSGLLHVESVEGGRTKSGKWRTIPLNASAVLALAQLGEDQLVGVHQDTISDWFKKDASAAKIKGTTHWLRHTFCTGLVQSGINLYDVMRLAGHSSITQTEKYAHHSPGFGQSAVDALDSWGNSTPNSTAKSKRIKKSFKNNKAP